MSNYNEEEFLLNYIISKVQMTLGKVYLLSLVLISVIQLNQIVNPATNLNKSSSKIDVIEKAIQIKNINITSMD